MLKTTNIPAGLWEAEKQKIRISVIYTQLYWNIYLDGIFNAMVRFLIVEHHMMNLYHLLSQKTSYILFLFLPIVQNVVDDIGGA